jgi:ATP-dependent DNA ligase
MPILSSMRSTFEFCLPTKSDAVPTGPDWLHEVKYDGYRLRVERDGDRGRLITRGGYNWTDRSGDGSVQVATARLLTHIRLGSC